MLVILSILCVLLFVFLFYASYNIRSGIYLKVFCRKKTNEKIVSLTFDDGPDPIQTPKVLEVLKQYAVPATFFCIGSKVPGNEEIIRRIVAEGHSIGNHSFSHSSAFPFFTTAQMTKDLLQCQKILESYATGRVLWFRPPFGVTNPTIAGAIKKLGYFPIGWNIRTFDTQSISSDKIITRIGKKLQPGSIILLHDRMPGSERLLSKVIELMKEKGYKIVKLDTMVKES